MKPVQLPPRLREFNNSPDGRLAVIADAPGSIWRLNLTDGSTRKLASGIIAPSDIAFSPNGKLMAISSVSSVTWMWNTAAKNFRNHSQ